MLLLNKKSSLSEKVRVPITPHMQVKHPVCINALFCRFHRLCSLLLEKYIFLFNV